MSSTKVINLGNTCSTFGFNAVSVPPTTSGNYYAFTSPNPASYVMLGSNNFLYLVSISSACIPLNSSLFNYNMFNIGLMWSPNIPGGNYNGNQYYNGDPRLRILTSYWLENVMNTSVLNLPTSAWTLVELSDPANPSTSNITIIRTPTDTSITQTLTGIGWVYLQAGYYIPRTTISPVPTSTTVFNSSTYYLTKTPSFTNNPSLPKNVYNTSLQTVDLNSALMPTGTFATIITPQVTISMFTSTSPPISTAVPFGLTTTVNDWNTTPSNFKQKVILSGIYTNILVSTFGQANSTTGVINNGSTLDVSAQIFMQSTQPTADPDPVFSTASENGIIFIPVYPATALGTNTVLGIASPITPVFSFNSYFSFTPPISFGYFLTYPLNYEEASPTLEAGSDFLLLTPDNAYIVYVNGSGALATQSSNKLTASPSTINFQTYGGYWKAVGVVGKGFQLAYVTTTTTYYIVFNSIGTLATSTIAGSTFNCMHCSPVNYLCQLGQ